VRASPLLGQWLPDARKRRHLGSWAEGEEEVGVLKPDQADVRIDGTRERLHGRAVSDLITKMRRSNAPLAVVSSTQTITPRSKYCSAVRTPPPPSAGSPYSGKKPG
jgi:hypothetical protein